MRADCHSRLATPCAWRGRESIKNFMPQADPPVAEMLDSRFRLPAMLRIAMQAGGNDSIEVHNLSSKLRGYKNN